MTRQGRAGAAVQCVTLEAEIFFNQSLTEKGRMLVATGEEGKMQHPALTACSTQANVLFLHTFSALQAGLEKVRLFLNERNSQQRLRKVC